MSLLPKVKSFRGVWEFITKVSPLVYLLFIMVLFATAAWSGYRAPFDNDEFQNAHMVYLLAGGQRAFVDFYSIYSPIFHWLLVPLFNAVGYTWSALLAGRVVMIALLAVRVVLGFFIAQRLFGRVAAYLFAALLLMDPFTLLAGTQIRPDSLMLTLFLGALLFLITSDGKNQRKLFASGFLFAATVLVSIKILPAVAILGLWAIWWHLGVRKNHAGLMPLIAGFFVPFALFVSYFWINGSLDAMWTQMVLDAQLTNATRHYPVTPGFFYQPANSFLYGASSRSVVWLSALLLPMVGCAGVFIALAGAGKQRLKEYASTIAASLAVGLGLLWLANQLITSVFVQYYLPVTLLSALFAAYALSYVWHSTSHVYGVRFLVGILALVCGVGLGVETHKANDVRSMRDGGIYSKRVTENWWSKVPETEPVFPDLLFRPSSYPITVGYFVGEVPTVIRQRYVPIPTYLTSRNVRFAIVSDYALKFLLPGEREFIQASYTAPSPSDPDFRLRIR